MKIAVGSTSDSKLRATRAVFARIDPRAGVEAVPVNSIVSEQPIGDRETIAGALHRAREGRRLTDADYGIGIEGGVHQDERGVWICAWVAVVDREGREGLGCGLRLRLPDWIAARALAGEPVGQIVDTFLGVSEAHEVHGVVGVLTRGLVDRQAALEQALLAALAPFLSAEIYTRKPD
ncbi:MAG: inosine/xanthosine triphosphatase [Armatimonadetes bacterium]|nr:inosine/xanthosine triphosphatase [Armatimonadota bacterium]